MTVGSDAVDEWFDAQSHSMTDAARAIRAAIHRAVPDVVESIKWQAPNFATHDDFATFSMRRPGVLQVILHTGAKQKPDAARIDVDDLGGRVRWASHNRAVITFTGADDVGQAVPELERLVAAWVAQVPK